MLDEDASDIEKLRINCNSNLRSSNKTCVNDLSVDQNRRMRAITDDVFRSLAIQRSIKV